MLSDNLEDGLETGRRASGELLTRAPLETAQSQGPIVQKPARRASASDSFAEAAERERRLGALVHANYALLWRTLRRLGIAEAEIHDALEEVFLVALSRLDGIEEARERGFLLSLTLRVASTRCGVMGRRRQQGEDSSAEPADPLSALEQLTDRRRARALLDEILDGMWLKSRTVFVLLELEGLGVLEIAELLDIPVQTVGPRVRGARESFRRIAARHQLSSPVPQGPGVTGLCRMLDEGASPVERWLLESAEQDVPPEDGPRTLIRTLGVGTSLARADAPGTNGTAAHAGLKAVAGSGGVERAVTSKGLLVMGAKWLGAGLVAGALATGALRWLSAPHASQTPAAPTPATALAAQSAKDASKPLARTPAQSPKDTKLPARTSARTAQNPSKPVSIPASPQIGSASDGSRTDEPRHGAKAQATTTVPRRVVAAPSASRRPARPARSEPAARRTPRAAAPSRPSTPAASSVAAFPDS